MTPRPSPIVRVAVEHHPATTAAVPAVRAATVRHLHAWCVNPTAMESAALVVTELTANAAKISRGDGVVALRLTIAEGTLTLEVWDGSDTPPALVEANTDDESGRGLLLVDALSLRWSWYLPRTGGKVVWAQLATQTPPAHPPSSAAGSVLPTRPPVRGPAAAARPVAYATDSELLQRVIDGLRGLDGWQRPNPDTTARYDHDSRPCHTAAQPPGTRR